MELNERVRAFLEHVRTSCPTDVVKAFECELGKEQNPNTAKLTLLLDRARNSSPSIIAREKAVLRGILHSCNA